ncbi:MAG TPA: hypothetical protein VGA44_07895 [Steroidobacteraceae bacterium]
MPRIELMMSVFAGVCGGLVGVLWNGVVSSAWLRKLELPTPLAIDGETLRALIAGAAGHALAGALQGLLFWAGWSLIALVHMPWYLVGAVFGLLCWAGTALPTLLSLRLRLRMPPRLTYASATEWLVSCLAVGLFCAYTWRHIA